MPARDDEIAELLTSRGNTLAVAESLTGGLLSSRLARRPGASAWYRGAVVAYSSEVKYRLLGVRPGPVVSGQAALDMAHGVAKLLDATVALAVTGVGGPEPQDGQPPGTVWVAVSANGDDVVLQLNLRGEPGEVVDSTCRYSFELLAEHLADSCL